MYRLTFIIVALCLTLLSFWPAAAQAAENGLVIDQKIVQGTLQVKGVAKHHVFRKWQLDLLIDGDEHQATFLALGEEQQPALGVLTEFDTTRYPDGEHKLRLRVAYANLQYDEYFTPVKFVNHSPVEEVQTSLAAQPEQEAPEQVVGEAQVTNRLDLSNAPVDGKRWIEVDLSEQTLTAWQGDVAVMRTLVSTGRPQTPTVLGRYYINTKLPSQRMRGPGYDLPNVPSVMYFFRGYAIHGAYWHNNFGQTMSHGCVNLPLEEAAALFEWASIGTEVYVHE